ncbi:MAG: alpha/beta fold hydrolase [Acidobacteria bacterium]|nr:alpha/beta fold hydrolase [Acidobacteriota bacterium]
MRLLFAAILATSLLPAQTAAGGDYAAAFETWLTRQAERHWDERERTIAALQSSADIQSRQQHVRKTIAELIGTLPAEKSPLNPRITGKFQRDGYTVENVIFESQPGFRVTANLYLPSSGARPFPAVLGVAGHSNNGKASATYQAAFIGLVKQGFAVLAFDPPGQGERSEYYDPETGKSRAGIGTGEHTMAGLQCLLTGHTMARYEIWDGIRAFDYLLTRPEIDPRRIAVAGNSGGGTQAAYLAAVEPRLAAIVSSCYMTRWRELWSGPGPQDAEQVFPSFVSKGLDFGDFALAWAPRPYLMTTAIQDFFPIAGARATYKQTERLFDLLKGGDRAGYFEYDDTHGWSKPRRQAAYRFLSKWLQNRDTGGTEPPVQPEEETLLYATETGQLATSGGSETVQSLNLRFARELARQRPALTVDRLRSALGFQAPNPPVIRKLGSAMQAGIEVEKLEMLVEGGVPIPVLFFRPGALSGKRAVLFVSTFGKGSDADLLALVNAGTPVLAVDPRGMGESYKPSGRSGYRQSYQTAARVILLGRNLVEMQAADLIAAAGYLQSRTESAGRKLTLYAKGAAGPAAIFAAALSESIAELAVERSIVSYMDVAKARIHEGLDQTVVPGILAHADLPDIIRLLRGRAVTLISPTQPNGHPLSKKAAEASLGTAPARIVLRGEGWSIARTMPEWETGVN